MRSKVLDLLKSGKALTFNEIVAFFNINNKSELEKILNNLVDELEIYVTRKGKYSVFENSKMLKGEVLVLNDGNGYVKLDDYEQIYVIKRDLQCAKTGDIVAVELTNKKGQQRYGRVVKIKVRENAKVVGELVIKKNRAFILPDKKQDYRINYTGPLDNLIDGMKVVAEVTDKINIDTYDSRIVEVLGHKDDPNIDMISILKEHNIEIEFPDEVMEEIENIPNEVTAEDIEECLNHGGVDLRSERTVTIDGDDTKDFDDAITIKKLNDYYDLKVSIANVSNYVKVDTNLFNDAVKRGTSVYIPGSNVPMLPRKLSNGVCSLNPNVDRLALTFELLIDKEGHIVDFAIYDSIINSKKRMTYSAVNKILEEGIIPEDYEDYLSDLKLMEELHHILRKNKMDRGFIDFEILENKISVDSNGKPQSIKVLPRGIAEKIIEDFMVITGETSSKFLDDIKKDAHIYRVHGAPNNDKVEKLRAYLKIINCETSRLSDMTSKNIQMFLEQIKDRKEYLIIARELLKCMQKAIYSTRNIGHFALCSDSTCQVTSPIRRAGDLLNHVLIRENIYHISKGSLNENKLAYLANQASVTERTAAACEIETKKVKAAEYMSEHIGEEFEGTITYINRFGFYVELPNLVEGFVDIKSLPEQGYAYDENKFAMINKHNGKRYFLGDKVNIIVKSANKQQREVLFEIKAKTKNKEKKLNY